MFKCLCVVSQARQVNIYGESISKDKMTLGRGRDIDMLYIITNFGWATC